MNFNYDAMVNKSIPEDFGQVNGTPILNKNQVLAEVNKVLEKDDPSVEYILVKPFSYFPLLFGYGFNFNSYGHSAVRYKDPNGNDIVMNVEGKKEGKLMVQFYDATDYFYGTDGKSIASQKGVYNRDMVGIRVEKLDQKDINEMHEYFLHLREQEQKYHNKKFNIALGPILNTIGNILPLPEYGNCAKWTSEGLKRAGVVTSVSMWPKSVLIDMFENYKDTKAKTKDNISIVYYESPSQAKLSYGTRDLTLELVAPLQYVRSFFYSNLKYYSNCVVRVPKDSIEAKVLLNPFPKQQSQFRNTVNNPIFIAGSVITSALLIRRGARNIGFRPIYNAKMWMKNTFNKNKSI